VKAFWLTFGFLLVLFSICSADSRVAPDPSNPARPFVLKMYDLLGDKGQMEHNFRRKRQETIPLAIKIFESDTDRFGEWASGAINMLGFLEKDLPVDILMQALKDSRPFVKRAAFSALGRTRNPEVIPMIAPYLDLSDLGVSAARALGQIGTPKATELLLQTFKTTTNERTRLACIIALGEIADVQASEPLKERQAKAANDHEQRAYVNALRRIELVASPDREQKLQKWIEEAATSASWEDFTWGLRKTAELKLTGLIPALRRLFEQTKAEGTALATRSKKPYRLGLDPWSYSIVRTLHELGGSLTIEEKKVLEEEGLLKP
jgi:hypothetical protein